MFLFSSEFMYIGGKEKDPFQNVGLLNYLHFTDSMDQTFAAAYHVVVNWYSEGKG